MSLLGSFSRTTSGSFSTKTATSSVMTALCPRLHPHDQSLPRRRRDLHCPSKRPRPPSLTPDVAESLFLDALARASLCKKHQRPFSSIHRPCSARFGTSSRRKDPPHDSAAEALQDEPANSAPITIPREELRSLVDQYDSIAYDAQPEPQNDSDHSPPPSRPPPPRIPHRDPIPAETHHQRLAIDYIITLLEDEHTPHASLFKAYKALPLPRIAYLDNFHIRKLMHHFSVVEYRDEESMLRYLSLVDDMFAADIPMTVFEWNSAIAFAGRYVKKVTDVQVETATQIWLRMEKEASVQSNHVTFNILFDVASKAGKFALADVIMKEMVQRKLEPNRYFRTNKIYYYGLKRDGEAVRTAYKELVDSGEFVDTIVLNCVIASLIKAGEASAAEFIFERMKRLSVEKAGTQQTIRGWRAKRDLGKVLDNAARQLRHSPERRTTVQDATPISPDLTTYRLLIKYHAHESGNIDRVSELFDELHSAGLNVHGSIFFQLFRGFVLHGGIRYSSWTKYKLDSLWNLFCQYVEKDAAKEQTRGAWLSEEDRGCYFDVPIIVLVLQAYNKVTGKETTLRVWQEILELWKPEKQDLDSVNMALAHLFA